MNPPPHQVVGSETQNFETYTLNTGIQRVVRETHALLTELLAVQGIPLVPFHTRDLPRSSRYERNAYLASDPVLRQHPYDFDRLDACLFLDLNVNMDFSRVFAARKRRRIPTVFLVHDTLPILHPQWFPEGAALSFRIWLQQVLQVADHIVVTSQKVKADLLDLGWRIKAEIHVMPLGATYPQGAPPRLPPSQVSLLYVATVAPRKGHDLLLDTFDTLRDRGVDVDLTIIGQRGWDIAEVVDRLTGHEDFGGRLRWHQNADDALVRAIARKCSVGVMPAGDEGFGLFVEEAIAMGLKVVASDLPVFVERSQPNLYFSKRSPAEFADAILAAQSAPWDREGSGVRTMRDFTSDLYELVNDVIRETPHT